MKNNNEIISTRVFKDSVKNDWTLVDWSDCIDKLPEVQSACLLDVIELDGGTINKTFKITTKKGVWVVRFNNDAPPGIHRPTEAKIIELIQPLSISPNLIAGNVEKGYLITEFFEGERWTPEEISQPEKLNQLQALLAPLHAINFNSKRTELVFRLVEYIHFFSKMDTGLKSAINKIVSQLNNLGFWKKQNHLIHFDLNPQNIISNGKEIKIIDWEYAGPGHPVIEWCVIQNYSKGDISKHLPNYPAISYQKKVQELIDLMMQMWQE